MKIEIIKLHNAVTQKGLFFHSVTLTHFDKLKSNIVDLYFGHKTDKEQMKWIFMI